MDETPVNTSSTKIRNVGAAPKGSRNALKHGLYAYKRMLDGGDLDQRSSLYNAPRQKEKEFVSALGGDPSPQQGSQSTTPYESRSTSGASMST